MMKNSAQNACNFVSLFFFFSLMVVVGYLLKLQGYEITDLTVRDMIIITLASFRLIRVVVFEKIFKFFRDFVKSRPSYYVFNTMKFIVTCPWCMGVWVSLMIIVFFYLIPYGQLLVYVLAISGVASIIVTITNLLVLKNKEMQKDRENIE
jgi:hypothetical protein